MRMLWQNDEKAFLDCFQPCHMKPSLSRTRREQPVQRRLSKAVSPLAHEASQAHICSGLLRFAVGSLGSGPRSRFSTNTNVYRVLMRKLCADTFRGRRKAMIFPDGSKAVIRYRSLGKSMPRLIYWRDCRRSETIDPNRILRDWILRPLFASPGSI